MIIFKILLIAGACAGGIAILVGAFRTKRPIRTFLGSALSGVIALIIVALTGNLTGAVLAVNGWTLLCSAAVGIPGVILMLGIKLIWGV